MKGSALPANPAAIDFLIKSLLSILIISYFVTKLFLIVKLTYFVSKYRKNFLNSQKN